MNQQKTNAELLQGENTAISELFGTIASSCPCDGCNPPSDKCPNLNFYGDIVKRDLERYIPMLKNKIVIEKNKLQAIRSRSRKLYTKRKSTNSKKSTDKVLKDLSKKLKYAENMLRPTFPPLEPLPPTCNVPLYLLEHEIGYVTRIVDNNLEGKTVVDLAKKDIRAMRTNGAVLYKYPEEQFQEEDQKYFWNVLSGLKHGNVYRAAGTGSTVRIAISWTRITVAKELLYQCDEYTPMSFAELEPHHKETGELINLTVGEITTMMAHWFPLCEINPLRAMVQFFSRLRQLCLENNGEIHIPYIILTDNIKLTGDSSLGFNLDEIPSALKDVLDHTFPGINAAYTYIAIIGSFFTLHAEDSNLNSMSVNYGGYPKVWLVMNGEATKHVHANLHQLVPVDAANIPTTPCFIQHKRTLIDPELFRRWSVDFKIFVHTPASVIFTGSGCLHQGVNTGCGVAKAANLALEDMLDHGTKSVRLLSNCSCEDIQRFVMNDPTTDSLITKLKEESLSKNPIIHDMEELSRILKSRTPELKSMHVCPMENCQAIIAENNTKESEIFPCNEKPSVSVSSSSATGTRQHAGPRPYRRYNWNELIDHDGRYKCNKCDRRSFRTKRLVREHMSLAHFNVSDVTYPCEDCMKVFQTKRGRSNHYKQTHTGAIYTCDCGETFANVSQRNYHSKTRCPNKAKKDKSTTIPTN